MTTSFQVSTIDALMQVENAKEALKIFEQIESPSASTMRELISKWQNGEET